MSNAVNKATYARDVQVLSKMLDNVTSARDVILRYKVCFIPTSKSSLHLNKDAFDLCSFYLAQFGEKIKLLTDKSREALSMSVDMNILKYFRNVIDHDYEHVNKIVLMAYIQSLVSNEFIQTIVDRIAYCKENKRI